MTKIFQILFFICLVAIEYLATTSSSIPVIEHTWDKANHFIAFFVLYILFSGGFNIFTLLGKVSLLFLFAFQIELMQYFIPNRNFSLWDIFADCVGIILAIVVLSLYTQYIKKKVTYLGFIER